MSDAGKAQGPVSRDVPTRPATRDGCAECIAQDIARVAYTLRAHRFLRCVDHLLDMLSPEPTYGDISRKELAREANAPLVEDEGLRPDSVLDALQPRGKELSHGLLTAEVNDFRCLPIAGERFGQPVAFGCLLEV